MRFIIAILCAGCGMADVTYDDPNTEDVDVDQGSNVNVTALKAIDGDGGEIGELITVGDNGVLAKILHQSVIIDVNLVTGFIRAHGLYGHEYHADDGCSGSPLAPAYYVPEELCGPSPLRRVVGSGSQDGWSEAEALWVFGEKAAYGKAWSLEYVDPDSGADSEAQSCIPQGVQCWVELAPFSTKGFPTPITLR